MTLFTTDYLEYYLTLVSWIVHNGIWAVLVASGVFAIPFIAIIIQEWLKARTEGADEGNKGVLSSMRIENRVWVAIVVLMFAGIPFIDIDLNTIQYDQSRSAQCQVNVPEPTETGWSQSFSTLNNQSAKVPIWWAFMHALSRAITGASVAAIPCGTDLRQIRMDINATRIDDPIWRRKSPTSPTTATAPRVPSYLCSARSWTRNKCTMSHGSAPIISPAHRAITTTTVPTPRAMPGRMTAPATRVSRKCQAAAVIQTASNGGTTAAGACGQNCCNR